MASSSNSGYLLFPEHGEVMRWFQEPLLLSRFAHTTSNLRT